MTEVPVFKAEEFEALATTEAQPGVGELMVGPDFRVYRKTRGLMKIICQADPVDETVPAVYFDQADRNGYPEIGYLADLYDHFLSKYKREVMFVVGKKYQVEKGECPWFFMVPQQVGTLSSIEWKDKPGIDWFLEHARFLGTVHIHPGGGTLPSGTDTEHWGEKVCSGFHVIFGRDGSYSMYGSANGYVLSLESGSTQGIPRKYAPLTTSLDRDLDHLLLVPPPPKKIKGKWRRWGGRQQPFGKSPTAPDWWEEEFKFPKKAKTAWEYYLHSMSIAEVVGEDLQSFEELWIVQDGANVYLLDTADYKRYLEHRLAGGWDEAPRGVCFVPQGEVPQ